MPERDTVSQVMTAPARLEAMIASLTTATIEKVGSEHVETLGPSGQKKKKGFHQTNTTNGIRETPPPSEQSCPERGPSVYFTVPQNKNHMDNQEQLQATHGTRFGGGDTTNVKPAVEHDHNRGQ